MFNNNMTFTVLKAYGMRPMPGTWGVEVELEAENEFPQNVPNGWVVHQEGSLRGNGTEYVFRSPRKTDQVGIMMDVLDAALVNARTQIIQSYRTSTHIHRNVQETKIVDVFGVLILFALVEPMFLRLCGPTRDGNLFCLPSYDAGDLSEYFANLCGVMHGPSPGVCNPRGKYSSLNINPMTSFGSVEFRCFPSTTKKEHVLQWMTWITNIFDIVEACEDKTFRGLYLMAKADPLYLARRVFSDLSILQLNVLARPDTINDLILFGCEHAHELVYILQRASEEKKKKIKGKKVHLDLEAQQLDEMGVVLEPVQPGNGGW